MAGGLSNRSDFNGRYFNGHFDINRFNNSHFFARRRVFYSATNIILEITP
jgi:hypothetical protein